MCCLHFTAVLKQTVGLVIDSLDQRLFSGRNPELLLDICSPELRCLHP